VGGTLWDLPCFLLCSCKFFFSLFLIFVQNH
jgi:hypothetical protein